MIQRTKREIIQNNTYPSGFSVTIDDLVGRTFTDVRQDDDRLIFESEDGLRFIFYHFQDCCEYVRIEDICGNLEDLIGTPILLAEENTNSGYTDYESQTWTFYKFATIKGYVDIRWLGESNGYYSESVDLLCELF